MSLAFIILAAGKGTRMASDLPKVLHPVAQAPLLAHAMRTAAALNPEVTVVVAGHGAEQVREAVDGVDPEARLALQRAQLGTAHAVDQAQAAMEGFSGDVIVLYGDTPFIRPGTLRAMLAARRGGADVAVLGFEAAEPGRYGRLITRGDRLERIVEARDATEAELAVRLCNSGVICADRALLFELIAQVGNDNAAEEYYLTDIVALANGAGRRCVAVTCDEAETLGINSRAELATAEAVWQARRRDEAMREGTTLIAPETVHFAFDTVLGRDVEIEPNVVFGPGVTVQARARLRAFSHLEGCHVGPGAVIGPYARLRPGTRIGQHARIGNFVEIKAADIAEGAKVNHLSYVGDAEVGAGANIGAGTITCNYDGVMKHRTRIGAGAFIGSNAALVAPVSVGAEAMVAAGSTITGDVPDGALALARGKQSNKPGLARRLRARLMDLKAKAAGN
ncbi:UDP-N-acetylglucosamine pyrophosphorylase /glucosamine-1-phosphate N-acetyltransferase [Salinihabitans flavidus]|uniref:Bifunctional protein GlmU n=1 Tax=Salinihabitans flavidus TaxID=569882 RepID=A0A1H8V0Z3_9RHOB|nr:bifunctional UDP-N-acetylglucosamine diphosphorylase/glucosamine-1-phosphate N-acetyltransferase GlmU [Salinihabitans flavidus]SEP08887.1 UDP-N-acetylglucosamine pyrophosphorylase /glucosamine-1-phosphate N-acetyltransferase [Salinihabitans flavidus]